MKKYLIGDFLVEMDYGGMDVMPGINLPLFRYDGPWDGDVIHFSAAFEPLDPIMIRKLRGDNGVYEIYRYENQDALVYHWGNQLYGFAVWPDEFRVSYNPVLRNQTPLREDWFFSVCGFHRQLLKREAFVFHSSYVDIGGEAILFTGKSGIGKSTQASLWVEHRNANVVNGDRTLIRRRSDKWHAYGYPCCGTSGICENRAMPIRAIVVLAQGPENKVEQLSAREKIFSILSATELYPWDQSEIDMSLGIAQQVIAEVPIIRLTCRPDADAVAVLAKYLEV